MNILGIMSGSSLDGIDFAYCHFQSPIEWELMQAGTIPFPDDWHSTLQNIRQLDLIQLLSLDYRFNQLVVEGVKKILGTEYNEIDLICSHGHTVVHDPSQHLTFQMGNGGCLAALSNKDVVTDLRIQDIALGGQGTPLAPIVEKYLFPGHDMYLNLGGICNLSFHESDQITSFDIGPCNQLLNKLANVLHQDYDDKGSIARSGKLISSLLTQSLEHAYYSLPYPKSLDNTFVQTEFVHPYLMSEGIIADRLYTANILIANIIDRAISALNITAHSTMLVSGGGVHNTFLIDQISKLVSKRGVNIVIPEKQIVDYKEAILMACMGYLRLNQTANVMMSVTGASKNSIAGAYYKA